MSDDKDVFNEVSGSIGLTGAVDATLIVKRARASDEGTLHITGTGREAADYCGVSQKTIRRRIADGNLPAYRFSGPVRPHVEEHEVAVGVERPDLTAGRCWMAPAGLGKGHARTILDYRRTVPGATPKRISDGTALNYNTVRGTLRRIIQDDFIESDDAGYYFLRLSST